jgi:hypothetical protein
MRGSLSAEADRGKSRLMTDHIAAQVVIRLARARQIATGLAVTAVRTLVQAAARVVRLALAWASATAAASTRRPGRGGSGTGRSGWSGRSRRLGRVSRRGARWRRARIRIRSGIPIRALASARHEPRTHDRRDRANDLHHFSRPPRKGRKKAGRELQPGCRDDSPAIHGWRRGVLSGAAVIRVWQRVDTRQARSRSREDGKRNGDRARQLVDRERRAGDRRPREVDHPGVVREEEHLHPRRDLGDDAQRGP